MQSAGSNSGDVLQDCTVHVSATLHSDVRLHLPKNKIMSRWMFPVVSRALVISGPKQIL